MSARVAGLLLATAACTPTRVPLTDVKIVNVTLEETSSGCSETISGSGISVKEAARDVLVWGITNDCTSDQQLTLWVRPVKDSGGNEPGHPLTCLGDPAHVMVSDAATKKAFPISTGDARHASVVCRIEWKVLINGATGGKEKRKYHLMAELPGTGSPPPSPGGSPKAELALEVEP